MKRIIALGILLIVSVTNAYAWRSGTNPQFSKRGIINLNLFGGPATEQPFINFIKFGTYGPYGDAYDTGTPINQLVDANGYVTLSFNSPSKSWGGTISILPSTYYSGKYVFSWTGKGSIQITSGSFSLDGASTNCSLATDLFSGTNPKCILNYTGTSTSTFNFRAFSSDPDNNGSYIRDLKFYRLEDETDLLAGKIFRRSWKQLLVDYNPAAIRAMNWTGGNDWRQNRWSHRTPPNYVTYGGNSNCNASPAYGGTSGTNQMTLSSVSGTPVSMQHGELATTRITTGIARAGSFLITAITKDGTGGVVTYSLTGSAVSDPSNGDKVIFYNMTGMTQIQARVATISSVNTTSKTFKTDIDTSGFSNFSSGRFTQFVTLNISSRGEYPIYFTNALTPAGNYGNLYINSLDYYTFYFDKTISGYNDSSGTPVYGIWMFTNTSAATDYPGCHQAVPPIEVVVALVNELNEMGPVSPISLWINMPTWSLLSMDPDYSVAENWAVQTVNIALNGNGNYKPLRDQSLLFIEYSNETWNEAGGDFTQTNYLEQRGYQRWPASGSADSSSMSSLRTAVMMKDINDAFPAIKRQRVKGVLCGQGILGYGSSVSNKNWARINGTTYNLTDPSWPGGIPIDYAVGFCWATYLKTNSTYDNANLATLATNWAAAGTQAAKDAIIVTYVTAIETQAQGGSETMGNFINNILPTYVTGLGGLGKITFGYEGGWDHCITTNANGCTSFNQTAMDFLIAVRSSSIWATSYANFYAQIRALGSNIYMPSDYIELSIASPNANWGHARPTLYGAGNRYYPSGTEGSNLDEAWLKTGEVNRSITP